MSDKKPETDWAEMSANQRNTLIGELISGEALRTPYLAKSGGYLWDLRITDVEAYAKFLAEFQSTAAKWRRFLKNLNDERITEEDRGLLTVEIYSYHIRYSDTPGGGWMVVEAMRRAGIHIVIEATTAGWRVTADDLNPHHGRRSVESATMQDAVCQVALLVMPKGGGNV